jgi:Flp pilus assembly protein TadG
MRQFPVGALRQAGLAHRFWRDESGSYITVVALLMPVLIGTAGLGTEVGWWLYKHKNLQSAADSGAVSAATAGNNLTAEAGAVTQSYGYVDGLNGVTLTVNRPPTSGSYAAVAQAVEVVISQSHPRLLSALFGTEPVLITARAVAAPNFGTGCVLALDRGASPAATVKGSAELNLIGCNLYDNSSGSPALNVSGTATITAAQVGVVGDISGASSITTTYGIRTGIRPVADPYAEFSPNIPASCDTSSKLNIKGTTSLSPGSYCGDISVNAGATLTLDPGVYYLNGANLSVAGNATINGSGVTLIFTGSGSDWASANISSNANLTLSAPSSGATAGVVMYGDRRMPVGTAFALTGGGTQNFGGAIYLPQAALSYSGGNGMTTSCTKIIADTLTFTGNSNVKVDCSAFGTSSIGNNTAQLVE